MQAVFTAVLGFVFVAAAVTILYRIGMQWFSAEANPERLWGDVLHALVLFAALGVLYAVAGMMGVGMPQGATAPQGVFNALMGLVYVVAVVVILYRVGTEWLGGAALNPLNLLTTAFGAVVLFAAIGILHAVAASYGVVTPLLK